MNIKQQLLVAGAVVTLGGLGTAGVSAMSAGASPDEGSLVDKVMTRKVAMQGESESALFETKLARMADHQKTIEEELSELVKEGKLTAEQKEKLLSKQAELKALREAEFEAIKNKTKDEARSIIKDRRAELKAWAAENGIPEKYVELAVNIPWGHLSLRDDGSANGSVEPVMFVERHEN